MRALIATACALTISSVTPSGYAYHTKKDRQTDFSAYTLQQEQFRLGLFQEEYGIFNWWTVGTYLMPWLLIPVTRSFNGSLYTKLKFLDTGRFAAAFRPTFFYISYDDLQVQGLDDGDFQALVMPLVLTGSYIIDDAWTVSLEGTWVQTGIKGDVDSVQDSSLGGAIAESNLQFAAYVEYRLNRTVAFNLIGRYVPYITSATFHTTGDVDNSTSADLDGEIQLPGQNAWLLQAGVASSWKTFNFQFGLGYGNIILPGMRIVSAQKFIIPDFDLFWRF